MQSMSAAQREEWEWSMSFLNGSCCGELLHWQRINTFRKMNGEAEKWWKKNTLLSQMHVTNRQTDSWHFTPMSTINSLFIRGEEIRLRYGIDVDTHTFLGSNTHTYTNRRLWSQRTTPKRGSPFPPLVPKPPGMLTHLHPLQRQRGWLSCIQTAPHPLMNVTFSWYLHAWCWINMPNTKLEIKQSLAIMHNPSCKDLLQVTRTA